MRYSNHTAATVPLDRSQHDHSFNCLLYYRLGIVTPDYQHTAPGAIMNLATDKFSRHETRMINAITGLPVPAVMHSYESKGALYDVAVVNGGKLYRVDSGRWSNRIDAIKPIHAAIERHYGLDVSEAEQDYDRRVRALEAQGMTRSDAQGVVDAQEMQS